jgi:hypothetical protein
MKQSPQPYPNNLFLLEAQKREPTASKWVWRKEFKLKAGEIVRKMVFSTKYTSAS